MKKFGQKGVSAAQATFGGMNEEYGVEDESQDKEFEFIPDTESPDQVEIEVKENGKATEPFEIAKSDITSPKKEVSKVELKEDKK